MKIFFEKVKFGKKNNSRRRKKNHKNYPTYMVKGSIYGREYGTEAKGHRRRITHKITQRDHDDSSSQPW